MADQSRYGRYTGGPDPLAPPVDLSEALDAIGREVMAGYGPEQALREFLRRGQRGSQGLDDLARKVSQRRQEILARHNLDGTMREVRELLDQAVLAERKQLARDALMDDDDRAFREMQLQNLPSSTPAAVRELDSYAWQSTEARETFDQIKDLLGREALDQRFAGMKQALENATDADRERVTDMVKDLNELLAKRAQNADTDEDFRDFMARHGDMFPENPKNLDELLDTLAQRSAAAQRMLNSMSEEQRRELAELSEQAFGSPELANQLGQMDQLLQQLRPGEDWDGSEDFNGSQGMGLGEATGALQDLAELDQLAEQLSQAQPGARMDDVDIDALERQLGEQDAVDARTLAELERALRNSGHLNRGTDGELRLTPQAMRQLGQAILRQAIDRLSNRSGQRDAALAGSAGELTGASRPWEFGDTEPWDVTCTLTNAVLRQASEGPAVRGPGGSSPGVRLQIGDVEIAETEARTRAAVALLVDTSFSMVMDGRWIPMKRTALALHTLVSTRFRGDDLSLISFGRFARPMEIEELTALDAEYEQGTNLHHALLLANRHFRKHSGSQPMLLVVTDGEPTAHLESDGETFFDWPPHPMTIGQTVRELDNTRRLGARCTFFRLGEDEGLARFMEQLARRVDGTVVAPELDDLGAAVVGSYLREHREWDQFGI